MPLFDRRGVLGVAAAVASCRPSTPSAPPLRVAAAADLRDVLDAVCAEVVPTLGTRPELVYGASGSLYAQITHGAPFDLFLSADEAYPEGLSRSGAAVEVFRYATGALALWVSPRHPEAARAGLDALRHPAVRRVALANPAHAPYGRAAEATLRALHVSEDRPTRVYAENVAQSLALALADAVDAAFVAGSSSRRLAGHGVTVPVPAPLHPPLTQAGAVLRARGDLSRARAFARALTGPAGQAALRRYGFAPP